MTNKGPDFVHLSFGVNSPLTTTLTTMAEGFNLGGWPNLVGWIAFIHDMQLIHVDSWIFQFWLRQLWAIGRPGKINTHDPEVIYPRPCAANCFAFFQASCLSVSWAKAKKSDAVDDAMIDRTNYWNTSSRSSSFNGSQPPNKHATQTMRWVYE